MSKGGFDPDRVAPVKRDQPVIPQILSSETDHMAKGFTEIKVIGLGGAGNNTIDRMIESGVQGIDFIAVNSDRQALDRTLARKRIHVGERLTRGLGTGGDPRLGERAAESAREALREAMAGADMVFVTAGLGGGTGTGGAPIVGEIARQLGALSVAVVTVPFGFEGARRRGTALDGLEALRTEVDSVIVISNDRLLHTASANTGIRQAFQLADETLHQGIQGIADLILTPGLINLDYADVRSVMHRAGPALMAMGRASGENRAQRAAALALTNTLADTSIRGARAVLLNVTGSPDLTLHEVNSAAGDVADQVGPDCNIIFGAVIHPRLVDEVRITVIATGFDRD
ncbi:MAG: cell division protein FtsZ [Chloroflexota bacterium]